MRGRLRPARPASQSQPGPWAVEPGAARVLAGRAAKLERQHQPAGGERVAEALGPFDEADRGGEGVLEAELGDLARRAEAVEVGVPELERRRRDRRSAPGCSSARGCPRRGRGRRAARRSAPARRCSCRRRGRRSGRGNRRGRGAGRARGRAVRWPPGSASVRVESKSGPFRPACMGRPSTARARRGARAVPAAARSGAAREPARRVGAARSGRSAASVAAPSAAVSFRLPPAASTTRRASADADALGLAGAGAGGGAGGRRRRPSAASRSG